MPEPLIAMPATLWTGSLSAIICPPNCNAQPLLAYIFPPNP